MQGKGLNIMRRVKKNVYKIGRQKPEHSFRSRKLFRLGFIGGSIKEEARELIASCNQRYFLFLLKNSYGVVDSVAEKEKEIDMINKTIKGRCKRINEGVDLYNRMANEIDAAMQIDKLEPEELLRNIEKFYNIKGIIQEAYKEAKDFFFGEFGQHVYGKISRFWSSISDNHEIINRKIKEFDLDKIDTKWRDDFKEVVDLYLLGYRDASLLVLVKIYEKLIKKYLLGLLRDKELNKGKEEILEMKFENEIGLLKSRRDITDREWHVISKLQIDRNESGAHYTYNSKLEKQIDVEAGDTIKLAISIFLYFNRAMENLMSQMNGKTNDTGIFNYMVGK